MDEKQAKRLGNYLREQRSRAGLGTRAVADAAGVNQTTIVRLEAGSYLQPSLDKLTAIAEALSLEPADVLERAGYAGKPYLRTIYPALPDAALEDVDRYIRKIVKRHGKGPRSGEDERI